MWWCWKIILIVGNSKDVLTILFFFPVSLCAGHIYVHVWMPMEVRNQCQASFSLLLFTLEPGAHPVPLTGWSASPQYPLICLSAVRLKHGTWLLRVCWGSELRSSCLHGNHFTHWAVSLSHFFILLIIFKIRDEEGRERMLRLPTWILATSVTHPALASEVTDGHRGGCGCFAGFSPLLCQACSQHLVFVPSQPFQDHISPCYQW